jgi:hypothetical protein
MPNIIKRLDGTNTAPVKYQIIRGVGKQQLTAPESTHRPDGAIRSPRDSRGPLDNRGPKAPRSKRR